MTIDELFFYTMLFSAENVYDILCIMSYDMVSDPYSFILFLSFKKKKKPYSHTTANDQINPDKPVIPCWYWAKPVKFEALFAVMKYFRWLN